MMPSLDDSLSEEQLTQRRIFAKHEKLLGLMLDSWPGLLAIKDVTREPWTIVYMNEAMCRETEREFSQYYQKTLGQLLDIDVEALSAEDQAVIDGPFGELHEFAGLGLHGQTWRRERFKFSDGDKLYTVLSMKRMDDERQGL